MAPSAIQLPLALGSPLAQTTLRGQVHGRLRAAILSGALPPGKRLSPAELAETLGVSTMPVREALRLLEEEGLIETSSRRWTRVAVPDLALAEEVYPLVGMLEEAALVDATPPARQLLGQLRRTNDEFARAWGARDVAATIAADMMFHTTAVEVSENRTLRATLDGLRARIRLVEGLFFRIEPPPDSVERHAEAIDALAAGRMDMAGAALRANWSHGLDAIRKAIAAG